MRFLPVILISFLIALQVRAADVLPVGSADMAQAVRREFAEQGLGDAVEVEFFGGQTEFALENAAAFKILVSNLDISGGQHKFTADAEIFADGVSKSRTKLLGRYFILTEAWLPVKDIAKDKIIAEDDLEQVSIRTNRLREDSVVQKENLIGKQAVRLIKAGKPITSRDIREEIVIKRNQSVTAVYNYKGLQITSKLEAAEDGAEGQKIKLLNTKSGKEILGRVIDKNTVEIEAE